MSLTCSVAHEDYLVFLKQNKEDFAFFGVCSVPTQMQNFCFTMMVACVLFSRFVNFDRLDTFLIIKRTLFWT